MSITPLQFARAALALLFAVLLAACGGGGLVAVDSPASAVSVFSPRPLDPEYLARRAVNYSPYRSNNRDTEIVTSAMIKQDLELLVQADLRLIRLFDSSTILSKPNGGSAEMILQVIKDNNLDIKVHLGAYLQSVKYISTDTQQGRDKLAEVLTYNVDEGLRMIDLANRFTDGTGKKIVLALSVGNETMVSWSFNPIDPQVIGAAITLIRSQTTQPITSDDNWAVYAAPPKVITDNIDFVSMHTYGELDSVFNAVLWDWKQAGVSTALGTDGVPLRATAMMNAAIAHTKKEYQAVRDALDRKGLSAMPIVIGETGWNAVDKGALSFRAHPVNQKMYFQALNAWKDGARLTGAGPANIFHFEAFDEPWKGNDDMWGLFNVSRQARYVIQNVNPPSASWVYEPGAYSNADALYFIPLVKNPVVTANRYTVYADVAVPGALDATGTMAFNSFGGNTATVPQVPGAAEPTDGPNGIEITPNPQSYGWGVVRNLTNTLLAEDLSGFAGGTLHFSIRTTYAGKIEVGFSTGGTPTTDAFDVWMPLSPGQYGYLNDGQWHQVSIPIADLIPFGAKGFGMNNSPDAVFDLSKVTIPFVIADRYDHTGKDQNSGITTKIQIDAIFWTKP